MGGAHHPGGGAYYIFKHSSPGAVRGGEGGRRRERQNERKGVISEKIEMARKSIMGPHPYFYISDHVTLGFLFLKVVCIANVTRVAQTDPNGTILFTKGSSNCNGSLAHQCKSTPAAASVSQASLF